MSKQQYLWMLGLMAAWRQRVDGDDQDGQRLLLHAIYARAGVFQGVPAKSANDQVIAALFILLLILAWTGAKYRAKSSAFNPFMRELTPALFFGTILRDPLLAVLLAALTAGLRSDKSITSPQPVVT